MRKKCTLFFKGLKLMMTILCVVLVGNSVYANISVTAASGGTNICANKAADASAPAYTTLGNITVNENSDADLGNSFSGWTVTLTLAAPTGWQLNTAVAPTYSFSSGNDISSVTGTFSSGKLIVTITGSGRNDDDAFTIIGLQARASTAASNGSFSANGYIYAETKTGTITGLTTGSSGTNFGNLSQNPGAITGTANFCMPATVTLNDATSGGTWLSGNTATATVSGGGVVSGVASGTVNITYTASSCSTWRTVTVNAAPSISNNIALCANGTTNTLVGSPSGGTWQSTNASVATINSGSGLMTPGSSSGTTTISYTGTNGCAATIVGTVNGSPSSQSVTGGGSACSGATGVNVGLSDTDPGISYQLYSGSSPIGSSVSGTGSSVSFGPQTSTGTYTVRATNATTGCGRNMSGSASVTINPGPTLFSVTGGGAYCAGGTGMTVGLSGSQTGVNYQLYIGSSTNGSPVSGTGAALNFGLKTSAGTYTVTATNTSTSCVSGMTGSAAVSVNTNPTAFSVTGGGAYCAGGDGVEVGVSGSQAGINYQAYIGSTAVGIPVTGTGSTLSLGLQTSVGTYSVKATNATTSCVGSMTGNATVSTNTVPTAFSVTGGGAYCAGGTGVEVGLGGSQAGVNYQLYNGSTAVGSQVAGTGSALAFGTQTSAGTYNVSAVNASTSCTANMTGSAAVSVNSNPTVFSVTGGGAYCAGGTGVEVGLGGSQTGVNYQLYNGSTAVGSPVTGTGSALDFGSQTSAGTYNVSAVNASTSCAADMTSSAAVSVNSNPTAFSVTGGGAYCAGGTGVEVGLDGSQTGVNYQLYNGSTAVGSPVAGTGSALEFGSQTSAGTYNVSAVNASTSCAADMTSSAAVSVNNNPTAFSVTGGGGYCAGGTGVEVGLSGSQTGVNYQLYNGSTAVGSPVVGTGSALDFGSQTLAGTYNVSAVNASTSCAADMTSSAAVSVNNNPTAFSVTGGGGYCAGGTGVEVGLGGSQTGVNYQLYNGSTAVGSPVVGTGSALDFGSQTSAGTYNVSAVNASTSCAADMTSSAAVSVNNNPTAFSVTGGGGYCAGGTGVEVGLGGSQTGVNYQLYNGSTAVGSPVTGTGSALDFGSQTSAGTYNVSAVNASTSCAADMTSSAAVSVNNNPTAFSVTGGGAYCAGGTGVEVGLGGSQTGVNYQLYNGSTAVGSPVAGTGSALAFGSQTSAGTYNVSAVNASTSCAADMTSSAAVSVNNNPTAFSVTGGGAYCAGGTGVEVGLGGSQTGVNYQLYNGSTAVGSPVAGTGSALEFGSQTSAGTYNVSAVNASSSCAADMTSSAAVSVNNSPTVFSVTGGGAYCAGGTGVEVGLVGSQTGVNYQLYNGSTAVGSPVAGTGSALDFGSQTSAGTYNVSAVNTSTSCAADMTSSAAVSVNSNPTAFSVTGGGAYCAGGTGVEVGLGGSQTGVNYQLYNGSTPVGSPVTGTGSALDFGSQTSAGTYNVSAVNASTSCVADMTGSVSVNVNSMPDAGVITGTSVICQGSIVTLSNLTGDGTWSSSAAAIATVSSSGVVSGVSVGTATISYAVTNLCGTSAAARIVTVNPAPNAGTITGAASVCAGNTTTLSNAVSGGVWSSGAADIATVNSSGVVSSVAAGMVTISYAVTNGCGSTSVARVVTVNGAPSAGTIAGSSAVIVAGTITLSNAVSGGTWSSGSTGVATVSSSGVVTGVIAGAAIISYAVTNGCGTTVATKAVAVNPAGPVAVSGDLSVCVGNTTSQSASVAGGTWSSGNPAKATVSAAGIITGVAAGTARISYNMSGSVTTVVVTVNALPAAITGLLKVCPGTTTSLSDATVDGTWSTSDPLKATIGSTTGVVTGLTGGTTTIDYTIAGGCGRTSIVTVNVTPTISGSLAVCVGKTMTLSSSPAASSWSSSNPSVAAVVSGAMTGVAAGAADITVTAATGCKTVVNAIVNSLPPAISGTLATCVGSTTSLSNAMPGGAWSSYAPGFASVNSNGVVTGLVVSNVMITYTSGSGCYRTGALTVNAVPTIAGLPSMCEGSLAGLSVFPGAGGTWSSGDVLHATVAASTGMVTGVLAGTATINYISPIGCQTSRVVTVNVCSSRQAITGVGTTELNAQISMFPNPTNGLLTIQTPESGTLTVLAVDGKEVVSYSVKEGDTNISLPKELAAGVYMCRFSGNEGSSAMVRLIYQP